MQNYEKMKIKTSDFVRLWKNNTYFAPKSVIKKFSKTVLDWQVSLTDTLDIWIEKGVNMTDGELILANTNLGALVECWLKLFLCAYYEDYIQEPVIIKNKRIEPEEVKLELLKQFFQKRIFTASENHKWFDWIDDIQHKRNSIHSFQRREIGTSMDFLSNVQKYCDFVEYICDRFPTI